jgi:hypothetical protein
MANLKLKFEKDVKEGTRVKVTASSPDASKEWFYQWRFPAGGFIVEQPPDCFGSSVTWDTTGVIPGIHAIVVDASQVQGTWDRTEMQVPARLGPMDRAEGQVVVHPALGARPATPPKASPQAPAGPPPELVTSPLPGRQITDINVAMRKPQNELTDDVALWVLVRRSSEAMSFRNYDAMLGLFFCRDERGAKLKAGVENLKPRRFLPYNDTDAYRLLKVATEAFVLVNCGVYKPGFAFTANDARSASRRLRGDLEATDLDEFWANYLLSTNGSIDTRLPYLRLVVKNIGDPRLQDVVSRASAECGSSADHAQVDLCTGVLQEKLYCPCFLELIWSYWHEEGMLVQTMNAISRRFQNVRAPGERDPLANLEIDPLRTVNNLMWGYIQDEQHRLGLVRRSYEYDHHYGLRLEGRAIPPLQPADSRTRFLESFHNLLYASTIFFERDDDQMVIADAFPVLNALKEVHLILSEGAHNQFGELPATARIEMLMQQWLLARPEFREFLPTRAMVAYPEAWMSRVDAMKSVQGWTDSSVMHFHNLATFGESLLVTIRWGNWSEINEPAFAANWARFWRAEIQGYIHAYRAVTGVDLTAEATDPRQAASRNTLPSVHLRNRLAMQQRGRIGIEMAAAGEEYGSIKALPARARLLPRRKP